MTRGQIRKNDSWSFFTGLLLAVLLAPRLLSEKDIFKGGIFLRNAQYYISGISSRSTQLGLINFLMDGSISIIHTCSSQCLISSCSWGRSLDKNCFVFMSLFAFLILMSSQLNIQSWNIWGIMSSSCLVFWIRPCDIEGLQILTFCTHGHWAVRVL